jgi:glycosyltransferase involved in cell wall biosynthesis
MACKVAVAGSDSGAIPKVIGETGCLFPEGDAAALAALIDEMAASPVMRQHLIEQGYQRALAYYAVEQLAADILPIWRSLCQRTSLSRD